MWAHRNYEYKSANDGGGGSNGGQGNYVGGRKGWAGMRVVVSERQGGG